MLYFLGWLLFLIFFKIYFNIKVFGRRNVPHEGAFIFASNHTSYLDPIILGTSIHRSLNYMARENLFRRRFFGWLMGKLHSFPVKRGKADLSAIRQALRILKLDKPLVIFPEGTRAKDIELRHGKPGIGFIVARTRVPVVPAYIKGSFDALPRGVSTLKRHPVSVYIGKPINFDEHYLSANDKEAYQRISDEIMRQITYLKEKALA